MLLLVAILLMWASMEGGAQTIRGKSLACDALHIVSRKEWKARPSMRSASMAMPVNHLIIQHTVTDFCKNKGQCVRNVQFIQDFHLDERGWWDIAYNFLVGGDGRVYEGRGWNHTGAHSVNFNTRSLGVAFIGNFNKEIPTEPMISAALNLIECGVHKGYLTPSREIHGHRDVSCTESPGSNLYAIIRHWSNYKGGRIALYNCNILPDPVLNKDIINN